MASLPDVALDGPSPAFVPPVDGSRSLRVRQAGPRDLRTVVALRLALLREYPTHPVYGRLRADAEPRARQAFSAQLRSDGEALFLAERDGEAVGILRCVDSPGSPLLDPERYAYISSVFVRPTDRRQGVLRALLAAAEQWAQRRGLAEMRLHNVAGNEVAEHTWSALGFDIVEQVRIRPLHHSD